MNGWKQFGLTLVTAGLIPPILVTLAYFSFSIINGWSIDAAYALPSFVIVCTVGLVLAFLIVFPAFAFLNLKDWLNGWTALGVGIIEGLAPILALIFFKTLIDGQPSIELIPALCLIVATISGAFAGWLVRHRFSAKPEPKTDVF